MKKIALGIGAAALVASAAFANDQATTSTTAQADETKVAALDTSSAAFTKLDADSDGRVSAIEAANDTTLAAAFTQADADKDGYLSREEFQGLSGSGKASSSSSSSSSTQTQTDTTTPSDTTTTPPSDTTTPPQQ